MSVLAGHHGILPEATHNLIPTEQFRHRRAAEEGAVLSFSASAKDELILHTGSDTF